MGICQSSVIILWTNIQDREGTTILLFVKICKKLSMQYSVHIKTSMRLKMQIEFHTYVRLIFVTASMTGGVSNKRTVLPT